MDDTRRVVVQRGSTFETAQVEEVGPSHARLRGGWPEGGFQPTAKLVLDELELEVRVLQTGGGTVTVGPVTAGGWSSRAERALKRFLSTTSPR